MLALIVGPLGDGRRPCRWTGSRALLGRGDGRQDGLLELVRSNNQSELTSLEHGMHALRMTEKGRHGKSVDAYAATIERPRATVGIEVRVARAAGSLAQTLGIRSRSR